MVDLELYKIFYTVADCKNITKASKILNISQPAVTKYVKSLEEQLDTVLFIRTKKGVVLNDDGNRIYLKVKQALTLFEEVEKQLKENNTENKGIIKIGISTSLMKKFLLKYVEKFHELYPNIIINISTDPTKELIQQLKNGKIDFIISKFFDTIDLELNYKKLGHTNYIFVASDKYSELFDKKVNIKELESYPFLFQKSPSNSRKSVDDYLMKNNVNLVAKMNIASSNLLIDFACIGYGVGYVTKLYVLDELKSHKLKQINVYPSPEEVDYGIITLKNNVLSSHCKTFIDFILKSL